MKLTLLFIVISFLGMSQVQFSANTEADVIEILKLSKENSAQAEHELLERYPVYKMNGMYYVSVLAKVNANYNKAVLESQNVLVGSKINTILFCVQNFLIDFKKEIFGLMFLSTSIITAQKFFFFISL